MGASAPLRWFKVDYILLEEYERVVGKKKYCVFNSYRRNPLNGYSRR